MNGRSGNLQTFFRFGAVAAVLGAASGLAFAFWAEQSAGIFLALVDSGLSWCF